MKRIFLSLILIGLSILSFGKENKSNSQLTIISFNIRTGTINDGTNAWPYRTQGCIDMINDQSPDVIGLQEALEGQSKMLVEFTKNYKGLCIGKADNKGEQMSILYNTKTIKPLKANCFYNDDSRRIAAWALLQEKESGKKFYYINTHLSEESDELRSEQLSQIIDRIVDLNRNELPIVLGGDFEMDANSPALASLAKTLRNAKTSAVASDMSTTFHSWGKNKSGFSNDGFFYKGFDGCLVFEVVNKSFSDRKFISDHYPVKVIFSL